MPIAPAPLVESVDAIVRVSDPAAVVLFGSYARGDASENSDVDLLVIRSNEFKPGQSRRGELGQLYRSASKVCDIPKDILLFTRGEVEAWRGTTNHMIAAALKEGRLLYGEI